MGLGGSKHICLDCKAKRFVTRKEASHAARPKCYGCGSSRLEPEAVKEEVKMEETVKAN
jgi:transposase-like protein